MPATYEPIATSTLGSANSSITFSSIATTYTDLRLVLTGKVASTGSASSIRYNGDSTSIYSCTSLNGNGTAASSANRTNDRIVLSGWSSDDSTTIPCLMTVDVFSYRGSTYKTCLTTTSWDKNGTGIVYCTVGLWPNTAAITSFTFFNSNNWASGTTATLYGIKSA